MRIVPAALQAKLDAGVTTLAQCWTLARRDGVLLGFTDHDEDILLGAVTCRAGTGFAASEATSRFDLSTAGGELSGALDDASLNEDDLAAGLFDAAKIETWLVDWSDPAQCVLLGRGTLGEVTRAGETFTAELRGLADRLAQPSGRLYTATCNADLGDARCRADISSPSRSGGGAVLALESETRLRVEGLDAYADGLFSAGRVTFVSGANAGLAMEVKEHRVPATGVVLALWQAMPHPVASGDTFTVTAGCDKRFATCRDRFANTENFRGFPHIPGNDFIMSYPSAGTVAAGMPGGGAGAGGGAGGAGG